MGEKENKVFRLSEIIASAIRDGENRLDDKELEEWLDASPENRAAFEKFRSETELMGRYHRYKEIDIDGEIRDFNRRYAIGKKRRIYRRVAGYAAGVALVACGLWAYQFVAGGDDAYRPVAGKVELVLDNGQHIALTDTTSLAMYGTQSALISTADKSIDYTVVPATGRAADDVQYHTLKIPRGTNYRLVLSDNTEVWINSESNIRYPVVFADDSRTVYLEGEAYFKVARDESAPFRVVSGEVTTEVLGTEFNQRAYPDEQFITTTLVSGAVMTESREGGEAVRLAPGEQTEWSKKGRAFTRNRVNPYLYTAWKDGRFVFSDTRLEDLLSMLARWYDLDIRYDREEIREIRFTGDLSKEDDFRNILRIIEQNGRVEFTVKGNRISVGQPS